MGLERNRWDELPIEARRRIDQICDRFREALQTRTNSRIEDFLTADSELECDELLAKLMEEELSWRCENSLTMPNDFAQRFPGKEDLIRSVFEQLDSTATFRQGGPIPPQEESAGGEASPRFRIIRLHASGGLGEVFIAEDQELHREVALKEIRADYADDEDTRVRFVFEAEITGRLEHPGIVAVYGLGKRDGQRPYYAMRLIRGETLNEAIMRFHETKKRKGDRTERTMAFRDLLSRFVDVCNAIGYAHSRGILHRDIKPVNIMLGEFGETLVLDWGLAKPFSRSPEAALGESILLPALSDSQRKSATVEGVVAGTPAYMSPEQAAGQIHSLCPASDVYSLGATLYALLAGRTPFEGRDPSDVLKRVQEGAFLPLRNLESEVPRPLEAICTKALALRREDRYQSATELAEEIGRWLADEPVKAWPEPWKVRLGRFAKRHRSRVSAAIMVFFLALLNLPLLVSGTVGCLLCAAIAWPLWLFLRNPLWRAISLGWACAVCAWVLSQTPLVGQFEERMLDAFFCYRGQRPTTAKIVKISLDEDFLAGFRKPLIYASPEIAEIVTYAKRRGAAAIGLDLIVPDGLAHLEDLQEGGPGDATKLGRAIQEAGNIVLAELRQQKGWLLPLPQWRFKEFLAPEPDLADRGFVNLTVDDDGLVRRQQLMIADRGKAHLHFALALAARSRNVKPIWSNSEQALSLGERKLPLDEEQKLRINFVGPRAFPVVPFSTVLAASRGSQSAPTNFDLDRAIVIISEISANQADRHPTPYTMGWSILGRPLDLMSGGDIHANILATVFDDAFILPAPSWLAGLPVLLVFGALLGLAFTRLSPELSCVLGILHHVGWLVLGVVALGRFYWHVPMVPMFLLGFLTYTVTIAMRWHSVK